MCVLKNPGSLDREVVCMEAFEEFQPASQRHNFLGKDGLQIQGHPVVSNTYDVHQVEARLGKDVHLQRTNELSNE